MELEELLLELLEELEDELLLEELELEKLLLLEEDEKGGRPLSTLRY